MPIAATISLAAMAILGGTACAQVSVPGVEWHPVAEPKPLPNSVKSDPMPAKIEPTPSMPSKAKSADPIPLKPEMVQSLPFKAEAAQPVKFPPQEKLPIPAPGKPIPGYQPMAGEDKGEFAVRTDIPGLDRLTRRLSEAEFFQELREEARREPGLAKIYFPEEEPVSKVPYTGRQNPYMVRFVEPHYVMHGRLYFEQMNLERHGWDIGPLSPVVEAGVFFYDLALLPYHMGSNVCQRMDSSAGKCLPGDPTPLLLYREQFSVTGLVFQGAAIFGGWFAFP